jgi:hypothetical protein
MCLDVYLVIGLTFLFLRLGVTKIFNVESKEMTKFIEEGRSQYNLLQQRVDIPHYGLCWKSSVISLHDGCRHLTEDAQTDVALKFTDCFLKMSGHESYECENHPVRGDCIKNMPDRAFNAFTEFYTHVYNICFFLQSQIWHEETERTIDRLSTSSAHVSKQLEEAEEVQTMLLQQQRESMSVQQELLSHGLSLSDILHTSQNNLQAIMQEFRTSTFEQKKMLFEVFDRLTSLQAWAIGEISWLNTVVFYSSSMIVMYVVTATQRTQDARIWVFLIVTFNAVIERVFVNQFLQSSTDQPEMCNQNLYWWIWQCRKVMLSICAIWIAIAIYQYCDYNVVNHQLLLKIQKQNMDVIKFLEEIRNAGNDLDRKITLENELVQLSDVTLLQPASSAEERNELQRVKLHIKTKSPSSVSSSVNADTDKIDANINKKQKLSRRLVEIQNPCVRYNLRSMQTTPSIMWRETV